MIDNKKIVNEARTWIGTPFKHQGRLKGIGVDCVGLVIGVAKELNLSDFDTINYSRVPNVELMGSLLNEHLIEIPVDEAIMGDIFWIKIKQHPQHLAIKSEYGIIHATSEIGKCVETLINDALKRKIYKAFKYKG